MPSLSKITTWALILASLGSAMPSKTTVRSVESDCGRTCLSEIANKIMYSMLDHDPYSLPLAVPYKATENSHPAALGMMTSWRTITDIGPPNLMALDSKQGTGFFAVVIAEGNDSVKNILRVRFKVVNREISELEIFINRDRGDHGFSFSAAELPDNYPELMLPPANRTKANRQTLEHLSSALFSPSSNYTPPIGPDCQFSELGWRVVDAGTYSNGSTTPLSCTWPAEHPTDSSARVGLVVDEELGFTLTSGIVQGTVFAYQNISAFIPNQMSAPQKVQVEYFNAMKANGTVPLISPFGATGDTLELLQYYNGALQAMQINVYLSGPKMTSPWL